ncbi:MAG: alpha/beta hydrolase [Proteobacteria bacterium]|nr:alpha/beta hydrolase [Pseudomonadota bacterium]
MQFDFYKMLEKYTRDESIDEIVLIGHSLGGAIIANSLHTIEQLDTEKKIKKVQLLAPAVMKNPLLQIISNLPTLLFKNEGDKTESVEYATNARLKRIGGPSALSSFFDFIALIANAFRILRAVFNSTRVFTMPLEIHYAEDDGLVSASNFKDLEAEKKSAPSENKNAVQVVSYARGRHHLHAGNSYNHIELTKDTALVKTC